jgi:ubiquinone/menaquinone biosynthesis C-methylase UbiE
MLDMKQDSYYRDEKVARKFDSDRYGSRFGQYLENFEASTFLHLLNPEYTTVLDLGAGTGKLTIQLLLLSKEVIAADNSSEMLGVAKLKANELGLEIKAVACDANRLSFKDGAFECVFSSRTLMNLSDWRNGVREICRVSRGELVIDFPSNFSFASIDVILKKLIKLFRPETRVYNTISMNEASEEIRKNGFRTIHAEKQFFMPLAFHRCLNYPAISIKFERIFRILHITNLFGNPIVMKAMKNV